MIISDLHHIESATETEVIGGGCCYDPCEPVDPCKPVDPCNPIAKKRPYNVAGANAGAEAFGTNTKAYTSTGTLVIEGQYSGSGSSSFSESF
jgi:hypothetical protein